MEVNTMVKKEEKNSANIRTKKKGYGLDKYYEEESHMRNVKSDNWIDKYYEGEQKPRKKVEQRANEMTQQYISNKYDKQNQRIKETAGQTIQKRRGYGLDQYYREEPQIVKKEQQSVPKRGYGLDQYYEEEQKIKQEEQAIPKRGYGLDEYYEEEKETQKTTVNKGKHKKKKTLKKKLLTCFKILLILIILGIVAIFLFFKTSLFQKYKELWVQTAMTTMNHQYLATWFLSDEEIAEIMKKLEVENNENSNSSNIFIEQPEAKIQKNKEITVEKVTGKGYVGYVMQIPDASKVKLVDGRLSRKRFKIK